MVFCKRCDNHELCKSINYSLDGKNKIEPYTWYAVQARDIASEKNCYGKVSVVADDTPNIVHESVLILTDYNKELEEEARKNAR